jgi:hypothetical protein
MDRRDTARTAKLARGAVPSRNLKLEIPQAFLQVFLFLL